MFNYEQYMSFLRWGIAMASGFAVGKGWGTVEIWTSVGALVAGLAPLTWSLIRHTKAGQILATDAVPEVAGVVMKPTVAGEVLAKEVAKQTVPIAGTPAAASIAR